MPRTKKRNRTAAPNAAAGNGKRRGPVPKPAVEKFSDRFTFKLSREGKGRLMEQAAAAGYADVGRYVRAVLTGDRNSRADTGGIPLPAFDFNAGA